MAVTRTSTGALFSSAASGTVTFAAGATAGDLGILIVETANQAITTPTGWTLQKGGAGTGTGTAGAAAATMFSLYTKDSITAGDISGGIAISDSGDHQNAVLLTYSGYDTTGRGLGASVGGSGLNIITPASTSAATNGVGGAGNILVGDILLGIIVTDRDSSTVSTNTSPVWNNIAGSNSFIENVSSLTAAGGGIIVNELVPSGSSTGSASFSCSVTSTIMITCALQIFAPASGTTVAPSAGHLIFGGKTPSLTLALNPATGQLTYGGKVSSISVGTSVTPSTGHLVFTGKQPAVTLTTAVAASVGHLAFGGKVPIVTRTTAVSAAVGHLAFGGKTATVVLGVNVFPSVGHLTFGGKVPTITFTFAVSASVGHLAFGGKVPTISVSSGLLPSTGHLAFAGKVPTLTTTLNPATGHLTFAGHVAALGLAVGSNTGHIAFNGYVPTYGPGALGHIKVGLGSFVAKPVKVWNGAAWVEKPLKYWTGTVWRATSY